MSAPKLPKPVRAWAWQLPTRLGGNLCFWAEPDLVRLMKRIPSPDAVPIRVEIRPLPKRRKKSPSRAERTGKSKKGKR